MLSCEVLQCLLSEKKLAHQAQLMEPLEAWCSRFGMKLVVQDNLCRFVPIGMCRSWQVEGILELGHWGVQRYYLTTLLQRESCISLGFRV